MGVSYVNYLDLLEKNPYTGKWIKDVIKYLKRLNKDVDEEAGKSIKETGGHHKV